MLDARVCPGLRARCRRGLAQSHSHHHFSAGAGPGMGPMAGPWRTPALFAVGGGYSYGYGFPFYGSFAFNTVPFGYVPPFLLMAPAMPRGWWSARRTDAPSGAVREPGPSGRGGGETAAARPDRAAQLVTLGDRNFPRGQRPPRGRALHPGDQRRPHRGRAAGPDGADRAQSAATTPRRPTSIARRWSPSPGG